MTLHAVKQRGRAYFYSVLQNRKISSKLYETSRKGSWCEGETARKVVKIYIQLSQKRRIRDDQIHNWEGGTGRLRDQAHHNPFPTRWRFSRKIFITQLTNQSTNNGSHSQFSSRRRDRLEFRLVTGHGHNGGRRSARGQSFCRNVRIALELSCSADAIIVVRRALFQMYWTRSRARIGGLWCRGQKGLAFILTTLWSSEQACQNLSSPELLRAEPDESERREPEEAGARSTDRDDAISPLHQIFPQTSRFHHPTTRTQDRQEQNDQYKRAKHCFPHNSLHQISSRGDPGAFSRYSHEDRGGYKLQNIRRDALVELKSEQICRGHLDAVAGRGTTRVTNLRWAAKLEDLSPNLTIAVTIAVPRRLVSFRRVAVTVTGIQLRGDGLELSNSDEASASWRVVIGRQRVDLDHTFNSDQAH